MDPEEAERLAEMLAEQADETVAIVDDLLTIARAEAGELEVRIAPVDLGAETAAVVPALSDDVEVEGAATVLADAQRVRQILRNLVSNALRHGGPHLSVSIASRPGVGVVEVVDDGPGLDAGAVEHLFEPYARSGTHEQSIGLGLWVSHELAERMGGGLAYERRDGRTVFRLTLPAEP
jgi:two-component system sensor histidine kinase MtrB